VLTTVDEKLEFWLEMTIGCEIVVVVKVVVVVCPLVSPKKRVGFP